MMLSGIGGFSSVAKNFQLNEKHSIESQTIYKNEISQPDTVEHKFNEVFRL